MITQSKNYERLCKQLPDLEKHIKNNEIRIIPIPSNIKKPIVPKWNTRNFSLTESFTYKNKKGKTVTQRGLKYHRGNYGILIGYRNKNMDYSIAVIDIDGYTLETDDKEKQHEIKKQTQKYIYEALKDLPNTLQVKTQSGGYHIYLWTKKVNPSTSNSSHSLYFPPDFPIKDLAGKCLNDSIEIFTNRGMKQCVLPSSTIYDKATKQKREYKVIGTLNKFNDIDIVDDINQTVINHLVNKGYTYEETPVTVPKGNSKKKTRKQTKKTKTSTDNDDDLKKLTNKEINRVVNLVTPVYNKIDGKKHEFTLYLGGYFSYHISKNSSSRIADKIINRIGNKFDDTEAFKHTLLQNYEEKERLKAGLPKLSKLILSYDKEFKITKFTDEIESICNSNFSKEMVGDITIEKNQIPIYLYSNGKTRWLLYTDIFPEMDLKLNMDKSNIGEFINKNTQEVITSFKFKLDHMYFNMSNPELNSTKDMLKVNGLKNDFPKHFVNYIRKSISNIDEFTLFPEEENDQEAILIRLLNSRNNVSLARRELGNYLNEHGTVLRRSLNTPYIENEYKGYDSVEPDDIIDYLYKIGNFELNTIHTDDVKNALGFISERIKPDYDIVKFKNCLYDMKKFKVIDTPENPILTLTEVQYNYNPEAEGKIIVEFLESSLRHPDDSEEKVQERVTGFYEMIGYLLTSGNPKNAWFILTGKSGGGKGTSANIITNIFGSEKIGHLQLQELTPDNNFATSHLVNKQVNIVSDSPTKPIEDKGLLKSITGYDDIPIEFKGKDKSILVKEEVPDMVTVCNNIPRFKDGFDDTIVRRAIIFHYPNLFAQTDDEKPILEELKEKPEEMEFLIYKGIEAYKDMIENGRDFKARISKTKTLELLNRNTDPVGTILQEIIKYNENSEDDGEEPVLRDDLNKLIVFIADKQGVNLPNIKDGLLTPQYIIQTVRRIFGLGNEYKIIPLNTEYDTVKKKYISERGLPDFCKTPKYYEYWEKMQEEENEQE